MQFVGEEFLSWVGSEGDLFCWASVDPPTEDLGLWKVPKKRDHTKRRKQKKNKKNKKRKEDAGLPKRSRAANRQGVAPRDHTPTPAQTAGGYSVLEGIRADHRISEGLPGTLHVPCTFTLLPP